jgi:hypothetical protein
LKLNKNTLFLGQKVWKNSEKSLESWEKRSEKVWKKFGKSLEKVRKLGISELSENYKKMTFNSKFENHEKLVLTRKPTQKFGMQGLSIYAALSSFLGKSISKNLNFSSIP